MKENTMEIKKVWMIIQERKDIYLSFYETKGEALAAARRMHVLDRQDITGIYETFAGYEEETGEYINLWSEDFPQIASICGFKGGLEVSEEDLENLKKEW